MNAVNNNKEVVLQPKLGRFDCTFPHHAMQLYNHVKELDN